MTAATVKAVLPELGGSRQRARAVVEAALARLSPSAEEPIIVIDGSAVLAMTQGFSDELIAASLPEHPLLSLVVTGLSDQESIDYLLASAKAHRVDGRIALA